MVCKNRIKEYIIISLLCAAVTACGAIWLDGYDITPAVLFGLASGVSVSLVLWGCACYEEHYVKKLRERVESHEKICCEGWAHMGEIDGWLFLSDSDLEFYPCNEEDEDYSIALDEIESVRATVFSIKIYGKDQMCKFHVYKPYIWKKIIRGAAKNCK